MLQYVGAQKRHAHTHTEIFFFLSIEYIENGCRTGCHRKNMLCVFVFKLKVVFIKCVCLRVCACIHVGVCVCVNLCVCVWNENERETTTTKPVLEVHKKWHTHTHPALLEFIAPLKLKRLNWTNTNDGKHTKRTN